MNKNKLLHTLFFLAISLILLTACGVKGDPEPYEGSEYPRNYPSS